MKSRLVLLFALLFALCAMRSASGQSFLSSDTYSLTTNAASRTIIVTNWPGSSAANFSWYPASVLLNNRGGSTGDVLKIEHLRTGVTSIHNTNGAFTVTNQLVLISTTSTANTNWTAGTRWPVAPPYDRLQITTSITNGELILNREILP